MSTGTNELTKTTEEIAFPKKHNVVILNDDQTHSDFVTKLLIKIFDKDQTIAENLTNEIHINGKAIAGTYSYELAEQKQFEAIAISRKCNFPLEIILETIE